MKNCNQTSSISVFEHGEMVRDRLKDLLRYLETNEKIFEWKLPEWIDIYRVELMENILSWEVLEEYTVFHDVSKPFCLTIDESGKQHFPNHAELSKKVWLEVGGTELAAELMGRDMEIHEIKANEVEWFIRDPKIAVSLLLTGLSEVHANAILFGSMDSVNFKIKWNQINKRGKKICKELFECVGKGK